MDGISNPTQQKEHNMKKRHAFLIQVTPNQPPIRLLLPVRAGQGVIRIHRTEADVRAGKQGQTISCANIVAARRLQIFGEDAVHIEFTQTGCFVIDRVNRAGEPTGCSMWKHNDGQFQKQFDSKPKRTVIRAGLADRVITLRPPAPRPSQAGLTTHVSRRDRSRATVIPYNGARRLWQAGIRISASTS